MPGVRQRKDGTAMITANVVSAGGVVYRRRDGMIEFAITLKSGQKPVWCLPKGLVEPGEAAEATAVRETREETGLVAEIEKPLGDAEYWYIAGEENVRYHKRVHYFLMGFKGGDPSDHDIEVAEVRWSPASEALKLLAYPSERKITAKAVMMLAAEDDF